MITPDPLHLLDTDVDKYRIVDFAGEGGFSAVYRAEHSLWGEPVAIKFFCHLASADEEAQAPLLEAFMREGKLMSRLSTRSSSIVQARDVGQLSRGDETIPYMVLEWVEGESLEDVLDFEAEQKLPARDLVTALDFLAPAGEALAHAHDADIAHRDLKPANFMILPEGGLKVLDFGIAKVMAGTGGPGSADTQTQLRSFTPGYGAPEQFTRAHGATGPWTDVFAMALILVEVLRGGAPVLDGSLYDNAVQSCDARHRPTPRHYGVTVPDAVDQVFRKALAVEPSERYLHMRDFWLALCVATGLEPPAWAREGGRADVTAISSRPDVIVEAAAPPAGPHERFEPASAIVDEVTLVSNTGPPRPDGRRWPLWLVAAVVASSAALVTGLSLQRPAPKSAMSPPRMALVPARAASSPATPAPAPERAPSPAPEATSSAATPPQPQRAATPPNLPRPRTKPTPASSTPTNAAAPVEPAAPEPTAPVVPTSPEPQAPPPAAPASDAFDPAGFGPRQ